MVYKFKFKNGELVVLKSKTHLNQECEILERYREINTDKNVYSVLLNNGRKGYVYECDLENILEINNKQEVVDEIIINTDNKQCKNKQLFKITTKDIYRKSILTMFFSIMLILLDMVLPIHIKEQFLMKDVFEFFTLILLLGAGIGFSLRYYEILRSEK